MTGRGGAEGYLFTGVRVRPAEGRVEARGKFVRKKEKAKTGERVVKGDEMEGVKEEEKDDIQEKGGDIEMSGS
jgi:tRNA (adenine-N(1)-)-methyltransferase non-catalytic subunit